MLDAVRRYATRVLLLHFVLFGVVLAVVFFAARAVYRSERRQAIDESSERLQLLAQQTSTGIENYYLSVMSDLNAILRDESETAATQIAETRRAVDASCGRAVWGCVGEWFAEWEERRRAGRWRGAEERDWVGG